MGSLNYDNEILKLKILHCVSNNDVTFISTHNNSSEKLSELPIFKGYEVIVAEKPYNKEYFLPSKAKFLMRAFNKPLLIMNSENLSYEDVDYILKEASLRRKNKIVFQVNYIQSINFYMKDMKKRFDKNNIKANILMIDSDSSFDSYEFEV